MDPQKAKAWIRSAVNAFTAYSTLGTLHHYSQRGIYATLPPRLSTPLMQQFKSDVSRLGWAYLAMGLFSVYRAFLYT